MKLQELLEKATERPWKIAPCACGSPVCTKFVLARPFNVDGRLTKSDALLQRHAVNNLENLFTTGKAFLPILEAVDLEEYHERGKTSLEITEFCQALRQTEEVKE